MTWTNAYKRFKSCTFFEDLKEGNIFFSSFIWFIKWLKIILHYFEISAFLSSLILKQCRITLENWRRHLEPPVLEKVSKIVAKVKFFWGFTQTLLNIKVVQPRHFSLAHGYIKAQCIKTLGFSNFWDFKHFGKLVKFSTVKPPNPLCGGFLKIKWWNVCLC